MKVRVGSKNGTKVQAVAEAMKESKTLQAAEVVGVEVVTEKFGHPITLELVVKGAMDRAKQAYKIATLAWGLKGGLLKYRIQKAAIWSWASAPYTMASNTVLGCRRRMNGQSQ